MRFIAVCVLALALAACGTETSPTVEGSVAPSASSSAGPSIQPAKESPSSSRSTAREYKLAAATVRAGGSVGISGTGCFTTSGTTPGQYVQIGLGVEPGGAFLSEENVIQVIPDGSWSGEVKIHADITPGKYTITPLCIYNNEPFGKYEPTSLEVTAA